MKITNSTPAIAASVPTAGTSAGRSESAKVEAAKSAERKTPELELQNSGMAQLLSQSSDVDMDKVNQIRQAIMEGRLSLDPEVLAEAVMGLHRR